jgi:two-component system, chemotaxis family, chemotaxis protein CheY
MKILVVDDSKAMRMIVTRALKSTAAYSGATILEAADGKQGLDAVLAESPDIILSDWNMPEMTGIEFLDALRGQGITTLFGFVTSESTPEMYDRAIGSGASFLVSKPFTAESIEQALAKAA